MSDIVVNGASAFFNSAVVVRANGSSESGTGSFDETLKGLKSKSSTSQPDKARVDRPAKDDSNNSSGKLASTAKRDAVKQEDELTNEQIAAASEEIISQVREIIREQFGISEEELSAVMDSLGIEDENLLETDILTQIVMKLDGIENQTDVLTHPDYMDDLKELMASVSEIKEKVQTDVIISEKQPEIREQTEMDEQLTDTREYTAPVEGESEEFTQLTATPENGMTGAETGEGQSDNLLKQDSSKGEATVENGVQNNQGIQLQDFAMKLTEDLSGRVGEEQATDIVRQVAEQVQVQAKQGITSMEMQIYPEHLGKVLVQVATKDGQVTAQITAETEAAKNAIESQLTLLKENLNNQGVKIESVQVTIASHAFEQNMQGEKEHEQQSGNGNKGRRAGRILEENFADDFQEEPEIMEARGNTVSYSA